MTAEGKRLVEFEVDGCRTLTGCIPEGPPADERWGSLSFTTDPYVGTSYGGSGLSGERCPNGPFNLDCAAITKLPEDAPPEEAALPAGSAEAEPTSSSEEEPAPSSQMTLNSLIETRSTGGK